MLFFSRKYILILALFAFLFLQVFATSHAAEHSIDEQHASSGCEVCVFGDNSQATDTEDMPCLAHEVAEVNHIFYNNIIDVSAFYTAYFSRAPPTFL